VNATVPPLVESGFEAMWLARNATFNVTYVAEWDAFTNNTLNPGVNGLLLHNIGAMQCQDWDRCLGTTDITGQCLCYAQ